MADIVMPVLGPEMNEGRILRWLKASGEAVRQGDPILEVEGDKTTVEITAPVAGILTVFAAEGVVAPVRQVIGRIGSGVESGTPADPNASSPTPGDDQRGGNAPSGSPRVSSLARKLADQLGVDLATVVPTGVGGRILEEDVRRAAAGPAAPVGAPTSVAAAPQALAGQPVARASAAPATDAEAESEVLALSPARRVTAERMAASWHAVPRVTLQVEVDMRRAVQMRAELNADWVPTGVKVSYDVMVVQATALALAAHPGMNARWEEGAGVRRFKAVNVGVAIDTERGLLVPVLRDVAGATLESITRQLDALAGRAKDGTLSPEEMAGGTFTVTNLGARGVDAFSPIVNPPQTGILAVGRIARRPWVDGDTLCVAETATLSLAFDHRVIDGGPAADMLAAVAYNLEHPLRLLASGR